MSSINFKCIGSGRVLAYLRNDLTKATRSLFIIGPWLDDYFAQAMTRAAPVNIEVRLLVRGKKNVDPVAWEHTQQAICIFRNHWIELKTRHLDLLHAKVICIDGEIVYVGSANWYQFSLEKSKEIVLRLPVREMANLKEELENLWELGIELDAMIEIPQANISQDRLNRVEPQKVGTGTNQEILDQLDALALQTLNENPTAWVKGKKVQKKTANWRPISSNDRKRF